MEYSLQEIFDIIHDYHMSINQAEETYTSAQVSSIYPEIKAKFGFEKNNDYHSKKSVVFQDRLIISNISELEREVKIKKLFTVKFQTQKYYRFFLAPDNPQKYDSYGINLSNLYFDCGDSQKALAFKKGEIVNIRGLILIDVSIDREFYPKGSPSCYINFIGEPAITKTSDQTSICN